MNWLAIVIVIGLALVLFKFIVKPLFKVVAVLVLVLVAWWLFKGF